MQMSEEAKKARRLYYKEYRKKNPDKQKEYNVKYWERIASKMEFAKEGV